MLAHVLHIDLLVSRHSLLMFAAPFMWVEEWKDSFDPEEVGGRMITRGDQNGLLVSNSGSCMPPKDPHVSMRNARGAITS